ncbi:Inner membrane protein ypdA [Chryseobacterium nakagawai]|uniref:Histidine kinase n=1 Tax=Chryseobacterium nakagawai TaxID=1241982 RepID=A0AAD1DTF5_CHRNA|nr:sensor histidine kinase [Chryseobacterium nakagawai]AZA93485.1 histidine kinase [Chryseobacterium nakagawai]VEH20172.1 Inner membrane protein ypdA [Chryseobacterium nakagawai]
MNNISNQIHQNRYFLLFVFLFAYVQSIHIRIVVRGTLDQYIFTPEAAVATFVSACILFFVIDFFIKSWQRSSTFSLKEIFKIFSSSLFVYLLVMKTISFLIALAFGTIERNFNEEALIFTTFSELIDGFIYGSFFLAYRYYKKNVIYQKQLLLYDQALSDSKINQLKTQLNPHFLFNNLNVLDQLIEEDKHKASDFLNEFAEIYRYVLDVSDKKLIAVKEELAFAEKYFNLIRHKYGSAYILQIDYENTTGNIVPLSLQLLLENAVQHNLGSQSNPVLITIHIREVIMVTNTIIPKRSIKKTSGRALNNLKEQYWVLTDQKLEMLKTETKFTVIIPIIPDKI